MENAYYERDSHSLQFFSFEVDGKTVHTSLSRDIVAHETAHALIDGIDPDLYDALDPQSLALHEGIADLTAMLLAFGSGPLRRGDPRRDRRLGSTSRTRSARSASSSATRSTRGPKPGCLRNLLNDEKLPVRPRPGRSQSLTRSARSSAACSTS